jgi:FixJ family two-component response regulator
MSGPEMVERYLMDHPAPVVVFMSGYADDDMMANSRSIRSAFIRKPFTPAQLACAVRTAIDQSMRAPRVPI